MNSWIYPGACLGIFAKAPEPGKVKTRLLPALSPADAANLQTSLIFRTLELVHRERLCRVQLWCTPSTDHPVFSRALTRYPISLHTQVGKDLGERMARAIAANLENSDCVVLIGCDCPSLTVQDLVDILSALQQGSDLVLGPASDGGYVLIGMNQLRTELFRDMPWGTAAVLTETRSRIKQLDLQCFETREQWDIDRPEDLQRYLLCRASTGEPSPMC